MDALEVLDRCGMRYSFEPVFEETPTWDGFTLHLNRWVLRYHPEDDREWEDLGDEPLYLHQKEMGPWSLFHELAHLLIAKTPTKPNYGAFWDPNNYSWGLAGFQKEAEELEERMAWFLSYAIGLWAGRSIESIEMERDLNPERTEIMYNLLSDREVNSRLEEAWNLFLLLVS